MDHILSTIFTIFYYIDSLEFDHVSYQSPGLNNQLYSEISVDIRIPIFQQIE